MYLIPILTIQSGVAKYKAQSLPLLPLIFSPPPPVPVDNGQALVAGKVCRVLPFSGPHEALLSPRTVHLGLSSLPQHHQAYRKGHGMPRHGRRPCQAFRAARPGLR